MKTATPPLPSRGARGFTILELMTAVMVLAILVGIGVPAFNNMIRSNQIAAESGNLVAALNIARSEALKRGVRVSVCALTADLEACSDDDPDWSHGWIVFSDDFGDAGVLDDSDEILQTWAPPADGVVIGTDAVAVTFTRQARAEFPEAFTITKEGCTKNQQRNLSVGISGNISLERVDCP